MVHDVPAPPLRPEFVIEATGRLFAVCQGFLDALGANGAEWLVAPTVQNMTTAQSATGVVFRVVLLRTRADGTVEHKAFTAVYDSQENYVDCIVEPATRVAPLEPQAE